MNSNDYFIKTYAAQVSLFFSSFVEISLFVIINSFALQVPFIIVSSCFISCLYLSGIDNVKVESSVFNANSFNVFNFLTLLIISKIIFMFSLLSLVVDLL